MAQTQIEMLIEVIGDKEIAEKVNSNLGEFMIPKGKFNEVNQKLKTLETETNSEIVTLRQQLAERDGELENIRTANMTEIEKIQHQLKQATENLAKRDFDNNKLEAIGVLTKAGLDEAQIEKIVNTHVTEDAEKSRLAIDLFVDVLSTKTNAAEQAAKDELFKKDTKIDDIGETPKTTNEINFERFTGMSIQERTELFETQPEVYQEFRNKQINNTQ